MSGIFLNLISAGESAAPVKYELWSWGRNHHGQLGLNDTDSRSSPVQVGALNTWDILPNAQYQNGGSITSDGLLWTWGYNLKGSVGDDTTIKRSSPVQIGALKTWTKLGGGHPSGDFVGIKSDGTMWTWGSGYSGRLGHGNQTHYSSPKQVGALTTWAYATFGGSMCIAVKTNGTLWSWGAGAGGRLGHNNTTYYSSPVQVGGLTNWARASSSGNFTIAVKTDGTLWGWGRNDYGQLGQDSTSGYVSSPIQIGGLTSWSKSMTSLRNCSALKTNGTLWSWGTGLYGGLGLGNTINYSSPKQVGALTTWSQIAAGYYHCRAAITTGGTLFTWGRNNYGQLGNGNTTNRSSPVQVGSLATWESVCGLRHSFIALKDPV